MPTQVVTGGSTVSAASFLQSLGVNTHAGYANGGYRNSSLIVQSLDYLGIGTIRTAFADLGTQGAVTGALADAGIKFDFVTSSATPATGAAGLGKYVASLAAFEKEHAGSIVAIEGLNEANLYSFSYNGSGSMAAAAQFQKALYQTVKADGTLNHVSVINLSIGIESAADYKALGNLGDYSDAANAHAYTATNQAADGVMEQSLARAKGASVGDRVVITETGYTTYAADTGLGVSELAQAKLTLDNLFNALENGVSQTFLYELLDSNLDPSGVEKERHFGLFNADGSPKLAATAIHNLTTILSYSDAGNGAGTAQPSYQLGGMPKDGHATILTKANGAYDIVLWRDALPWNSTTHTDVKVATAPVTVKLGAVQPTVYVYDPLAGTDPIAIYRNVSEITVAAGDRPLIIELGSAGPIRDLPSAVAANQTMTADQLVAQIDYLDGSTGLQSITLTGAHVLTVSSDDTMKYMVKEYGAILSKVAGGYSFMVTETGAGWREERGFDAAGKLQSTTDYNLSGSTVLSKHIVQSDGMVLDHIYSEGKLQTTVELAPGGTKTTSTYSTSGALAKAVVQTTNGDVETKTYTNGTLTNLTLTHRDGSRITETYDAKGAHLTEVVVDAKGTWTTILYNPATGAATNKYIQNADKSGENYAYGITGQSYATMHQGTDKNGNVVLVERFHADGSLDYTETTAANGLRTLTAYDATGHKLSAVGIAADGTRSTLTYVAATGALAKEVVQTGNGDVATKLYANGTLSNYTLVRADGSKVTDTFDAKGAQLTDVLVDTKGTWTTTIYNPATGAITNKYVQNADKSGENYAYGITGQSYATMHQVTDKNGKVVLVERFHADGSLDYTEATAGDGSRLLNTYDATGHKLAQVGTASDGTKTTITYTVATGAPAKEVVQSGNGDIATKLYTSGTVSNYTLVHADGSRMTDTYDGKGAHLTNVVVDAKGTWTTTLFDAASGAATNKYVQNADKSGENYTYGIKGQSYTTLHQVVDKNGGVTAIERFHADGSLDYSSTTARDGSRAITYYDEVGNKVMTVAVAVDGRMSSETFAPTSHAVLKLIQAETGVALVDDTSGGGSHPSVPANPVLTAPHDGAASPPAVTHTLPPAAPAEADGASAGFDGWGYLAGYGDLRAAFGADVAAAATHYEQHGRAEGRTTDHFDALRYLASNPDLALSLGTDVQAAERQYVLTGAAEGRPTDSFDPLVYAASNPDLVATVGTDPTALTLQYLTEGAAAGRPTASFDVMLYGASNPDVVQAVGGDRAALALHYLTIGAAAGRPVDGFDARQYAALNPDLAGTFGADINALTQHYIKYGIAEHRVTSGFDPVAYLLSYGDLGAAGLGASGALTHWITYGMHEGRVGDAIYGREQTSHEAVVGGRTHSEIDTAGDHDWFGVTLQAGDHVVVDLKGDLGTDHPLADPFLTLYDAAGHRLAFDDNGGGGHDASISFTASAGGTYYLAATSANPLGVGAYDLVIHH